MKRLYIAFLLIALSFTVCLFSTSQIKKQSQQLTDKLFEITEAIKSDDHTQAKKLLDEATQVMRKTELLFSFIVEADKIEEISVDFMMIKAHLADDNTEHALEKLHECSLILNEIAEDESLSFINIM